MKPLPRALLIPALSRPHPADSPVVPAQRGGVALVDLASTVPTLRHALAAGATTIALAGCRTGAELQHMATLLSVAEAEENRSEGSTGILALTHGILPAPVSPQSLAGKSARLIGVVWDRRALARTLGTTTAFTENGDWTSALAAARAATLFAAAMAGVPAYDSALATEEGDFARSCERSRDDGFFGRIAAGAAEVLIIEAIYAKA